MIGSKRTLFPASQAALVIAFAQRFPFTKGERSTSPTSQSGLAYLACMSAFLFPVLTKDRIGPVPLAAMFVLALVVSSLINNRVPVTAVTLKNVIMVLCGPVTSSLLSPLSVVGMVVVVLFVALQYFLAVLSTAGIACSKLFSLTRYTLWEFVIGALARLAPVSVAVIRALALLVVGEWLRFAAFGTRLLRYTFHVDLPKRLTVPRPLIAVRGVLRLLNYSIHSMGMR